MGEQIDFYNCFKSSSDDDLRKYYEQYKKFQKTGIIPENCELRRVADVYISKIPGAWTVPFTTDLLETIADRWMTKSKALISPVANEQKVYRINRGLSDPVEMIVTEVRFTSIIKGDTPVISFTTSDVKDNNQSLFFESDIGERVYLTKDEAVEKLKEMKESRCD